MYTILRRQSSAVTSRPAVQTADEQPGRERRGAIAGHEPLDQSQMDRDRVAAARGPIGPVMQFALLIVPIVISGFFLVYALTGWILEGRDHLNWSLEAEKVAVYVGFATLAYCTVVALWVRLKGGARWHPLIVSSVGHVVLAALLVASIFVTTRL